MTRLITKYGVYALSILIANLIAEIIIIKLFEYTSKPNYSSVMERMAVIVVVFIPVMSILEAYVRKLSKKYVQGSKKIAKNSFIGLLIGFALAILVLFTAYAYIWYDLKIWKI